MVIVAALGRNKVVVRAVVVVLAAGTAMDLGTAEVAQVVLAVDTVAFAPVLGLGIVELVESVGTGRRSAFVRIGRRLVRLVELVPALQRRHFACSRPLFAVQLG